jgi:hypothetical protein
MSTTAPSERVPPKKPYTPPRLIAYGDIAQLTAAVGFMGSVDGGMFFMSRTS